MATFPASLKYSEKGYSYSISPDVLRTVFSSKNTRQRLLRQNRDDTFNVSLRLDNSELAIFEEFIKDTLNNGADQFTGPYYVSDFEETGTLEIINGEYSVTYIANDQWDLSYQFEVKEHDITGQLNIYEVVNEYLGFDGASAILDALEDCVNNNDL